MFTDLTVAVIHYQTPELLEKCLARLLPAVPGARVLVVDSGDVSPLPADWQVPGVELMQVANHSFANAVNTALSLCETPYFAHMNADVFVERTSFGDLLSVLENDDSLGMTGPLALTGDGRWQDQGLPYRWWQWRASGPAFGWRFTSARTGRTVNSVRVPWLSGCLQVVRMAAVSVVGPMDITQRFTNEETDWCLRFARHRFGSALVDTSVVHLGGASTPSDPAFLIEGLRGSMVVSLRYAPAWRAALQRYAVWGWASLAGVFAVRPRFRLTARTIQKMFRERSFQQPVFGETLRDPLLPR